jgi:hypothetical protein
VKKINLKKEIMVTEKEKTEQLVKIAFKKGGIYVPNKGTLKDAADPAVTQFSHEMLHLGYILPEEAVLTMDEEYVKTFGVVLLNHINSFLGIGEIWKPFYKNFPKDIIDLTESEMLFNQMKHYLDGMIRILYKQCKLEKHHQQIVRNYIKQLCFLKRLLDKYTLLFLRIYKAGC